MILGGSRENVEFALPITWKGKGWRAQSASKDQCWGEKGGPVKCISTSH